MVVAEVLVVELLDVGGGIVLFADIAGVLAHTVLTRASTLDDCAGVISAVEWSQDSRCAISGAIFSSGG